MPQPVRVEVVEHGCRTLDWLRAVAGESYPVLLESSLHNTRLGQYSILCWNPFRKATCRAGCVTVESLRGSAAAVRSQAVFRTLSEEFAPLRLDLPDFPLPFAGGLVGFFSYDLRHEVEKLPRLCSYDLDVPEYVLCFYDSAIIFDHTKDVTLYVGPRGSRPPASPPAGRLAAPPQIEGSELRSNFTREQYLVAVQRVIDYIRAGDIFQANLSQRFEGLCSSDGLSIYERLRAINPAPFSAYMKYPDFEIISSSPERFLLVDGDRVTTRPIKGTRPRVEGDEAFNSRMRDALLASAKDHAELAMIVDLERNDLGRVCRYGSIKVTEHAVLETYPTVYHLVSTVEGRLYREQHDEFSLLRATFPGGSITGAPKIRAMEIIEELEPHARNIYTGSIGYISFHGRMDLNIVIRTMLKMNGRLYMQFGGGIVADSDPELEHRETLQKGKALFQAVAATNYDRIMGVAADE
jgi:para-aminobenzoate synthetase component 1